MPIAAHPPFAPLCEPELLARCLVSHRLASAEALAQAAQRAAETRQSLAECLLEMRALSLEDLLQALALSLDLPYLFAEEFPTVAPAVRALTPKYLQKYLACPVALDDGVLTVATADPLNPLLVEDLRQATGLEIRIAVSTPRAILEAIDCMYGTVSPLGRIADAVEDEPPEALEEDLDRVRDMASEAPVVRLVNLLIENALAADASDIHIEPFEDTLRVRYRIDGLLYDQESPPRRLRDAVTSRIKLMAEMNIAERRLPQDGKIRVALHGRRVDIRVSTLPTVHGESIVLRLLDRASLFLPLEQLGFPPETLQRFLALIHRPHGILLVTGPTGAGKTTTLYAALDKINAPDRKIITIEDPVEYQLRGVNQIPVKPKIGLTFATGLRHIVRQDPDVILVGEIRDLETVEIAIQAALTGHLVFSTLHTHDAPGAVPRLLDMGAEPYLVASVLDAVLAQRLVRRICPHCRTPHRPHPADLEALGVPAAPDTPLWRGRGCEACRGTGYRGRTGIYELFVLTDEARSLVLRRAGSRELRRLALEQGMRPLRLDGWSKACQGLTTVEEVLRVTQEDA
jgi:type II secretion system protein E